MAGAFPVSTSTVAYRPLGLMKDGNAPSASGKRGRAMGFSARASRAWSRV